MTKVYVVACNGASLPVAYRTLDRAKAAAETHGGLVTTSEDPFTGKAYSPEQIANAWVEHNDHGWYWDSDMEPLLSYSIEEVELEDEVQG